MAKTRYRRRSKMKRRGVENASQNALRNRSKMAPRRLGNGFKMAPGGLPGASREPKLIFDAFLASLGALLGAPGALLGRSWCSLGRSWPLLGGSWRLFLVLLRSGSLRERFRNDFGTMLVRNSLISEAIFPASRGLFLDLFFFQFFVRRCSESCSLCTWRKKRTQANSSRKPMVFVFMIFKVRLAAGVAARKAREDQKDDQNSTQKHEQKQQKT